MNRHLYGDMLPIKVTVPNYVVVKPGDLMLIARKGWIDLLLLIPERYPHYYSLQHLS